MNQPIVAGCVILDREGKILLIHRNTPERVQWELAGGMVEPGEDPETAARRELEEELGVMVIIIRELGGADFSQEKGAMHYRWFLAEVFDGVPVLMEEEYDDLRYFAWEELPAMKDEISANLVNLLAAYQKGEIVLS